MSEQKKFVPFVSSETKMAEFTLRALIIGLFLAVILGAANAYLGLKAGMTIAATYPAAVIGMALLKAMKGTILEENFTRTVGSIGESVAAGAIFTLPAFFIAGIWKEFYTPGHYVISALIMITGGILGIMFVALLRRVMVEDAELPFPESVAAAEIHKSGRSAGGNSKFLFWAMGFGGLIKAAGELKLFLPVWEKFVTFKSQFITGTGQAISAKGGLLIGTPGLKPAYLGVGYIIGPKLASLNFSGGLVAWGLLTPIIYYFLSSHIDLNAWAQYLVDNNLATDTDAAMKKISDPQFQMITIWKSIVRPIAIGGMLVGTVFTLWKMRKSLVAGIARSVGDVRKATQGGAVTDRIDKDLGFNWVMLGILGAALATFLITFLIFKTSLVVALVATIVMIIAGFFFGAVSGYLVGIIGSSNNPISGLTISTVVVTALLMWALGVSGEEGVPAVLGVAAIICVSAAVAGEMLQDLKAGHLLGGTPWRMQVGDIIGVVVAAAVMFIPIFILHEGDIAKGIQEGYEGGFGSRELPAPQASLMAILSGGIIQGNMAWPLIIVGMLLGTALILMQVRSPMLIAIGMYLPLETTFAIFTGGAIKGIMEMIQEKRKHNEAQKARTENVGILIAAGLIAGEALIGLLFAAFAFFDMKIWAFKHPSYITSLVILVIIALVLINLPLRKAGNPDEPAPPVASH
ncbi:MAG TPA: oligopeptide transporter, OPT family [Bacteroidia bacterium]|nr:oligopeptide transporter, OPT family [Bacteroidia bacterium]HRS58882.1 oligopeptide transporter, OPT family [Bacteroidia bacterium]HRU67379.1 oligopeptide transporter, OPT family [Bacteroidia bacterium]